MEQIKRYRGILKLEPEKTLEDGTYCGSYFHDLEHYFNADMEEIETVSFRYSQFESVRVWSPPRKWSYEALKNYKITDLTTGKVINPYIEWFDKL